MDVLNASHVCHAESAQLFDWFKNPEDNNVCDRERERAKVQREKLSKKKVQGWGFQGASQNLPNKNANNPICDLILAEPN